MLVQEKLSVRQACKLVALPRSVLMYQKKPKDDSSLIEALRELVDKHPAIAFGNAIIVCAEKDTTVTISGFTGCILC